jgi:hypothetical protein
MYGRAQHTHTHTHHRFLVKQDWFWFPILTFLEGFPNQTIEYRPSLLSTMSSQPPALTVLLLLHNSPEIFWFYGIQTGWYVYCSYAHVFQDSRKSDYWIMIVHHAVTLTLLYAAFVTGYFRIGMLVMFSMVAYYSPPLSIHVWSHHSIRANCSPRPFTGHLRHLRVFGQDAQDPGSGLYACHPPFLPQTVSSHPSISRAATIHPAFYLAVYATLPTVWVAFRYPLAAPSFVCVSSRDVAG